MAVEPANVAEAYIWCRHGQSCRGCRGQASGIPIECGELVHSTIHWEQVDHGLGTVTTAMPKRGQWGSVAWTLQASQWNGALLTQESLWREVDDTVIPSHLDNTHRILEESGESKPWVGTILA